MLSSLQPWKRIVSGRLCASGAAARQGHRHFDVVVEDQCIAVLLVHFRQAGGQRRRGELHRTARRLRAERVAVQVVPGGDGPDHPEREGVVEFRAEAEGLLNRQGFILRTTARAGRIEQRTEAAGHRRAAAGWQGDVGHPDLRRVAQAHIRATLRLDREREAVDPRAAGGDRQPDLGAAAVDVHLAEVLVGVELALGHHRRTERDPGGAALEAHALLVQVVLGLDRPADHEGIGCGGHGVAEGLLGLKDVLARVRALPMPAAANTAATVATRI